MIYIRCFFIILLVLKVQSINEKLVVVTKLPRNLLMKYTSYSSVMILHFNIPSDTASAVFKFKASDEPVSIFVSHCEPRDISVVMKSGSYPVINPDGVPFPSTFLNDSRPPMYDLKMKTDMQTHYLNLTSPVSGDWFAVSFVSWTDPKKDRIEQQGLSSQCDANIYAELLIEQKANITILTSNVPILIILSQIEPQLYKFYVPEDIDLVELSLRVVTFCKSCDNIQVTVKANSIPYDKNYLEKIIIDEYTDLYNMQFCPEENRWHYLNFSVLETKSKNKKEIIEIEITLKLKSSLYEPIEKNGMTRALFKTSVSKIMTVNDSSVGNYSYKEYGMMRLTGSENFMFEYDFRPDENGTTPLLLNVTNDNIAVLKFDIYKVIDIGGTLTIGLALKPERKTKQLKQNYTVVACINRDVRFIPEYPNKCLFNNLSVLSPIILNSSTAGTLKFVHIPFPEPGTWYISIKVFYTSCMSCSCSGECEKLHDSCFKECQKNCTDCNCLVKCKEKMSEDERCVSCTCQSACEKFNGTHSRNASMIFSITSHPCIAGRCGKYGKCNHYMAGGFIFSSCQCFGGYRGWDCSDGSHAHSETEILTSILLLTLSNLLFVGSVYFAYRRSYYTECVVYFFTMFFSTFYHACDSEENMYGFCLVRLGVLQFCDFYCGLLAIWVTLIAMSYMNKQLVSICHVGGAILLAFGTIYNKQALWVFLMPAISGVVIIGINWGIKCFTTKKLFPTRKYLKLYMPVGISLVFMGLISFAFLQTKENYKIVHSLWHVIMAVSVIFLLPNKEIFLPES